MNINSYPNPHDLIYFQEVARTLNLSRAAERLAVSQPALSLSMKRLEDQFDHQLFYRKRKGLELTAAGEILLKNSVELLEAWRNLVTATKRSKDEVKGQFRLGCHPSVAMYVLKQVLAKIYSEYEQLELVLVHGLSRLMTEKVVSGALDFAYVINPIPHPDLVIHRLAQDQVAFWATVGAPKNVLICDPDLSQTQALLKRNRRKEFSRTIFSENLEVIAMLVREGAGVAILPERVARAVPSQIKKLSSYATYTDEICFIYRHDLIKTAAIMVLIKEFKSVQV